MGEGNNKKQKRTFVVLKDQFVAVLRRSKTLLASVYDERKRQRQWKLKSRKYDGNSADNGPRSCHILYACRGAQFKLTHRNVFETIGDVENCLKEKLN